MFIKTMNSASTDNAGYVLNEILVELMIHDECTSSSNKFLVEFLFNEKEVIFSFGLINHSNLGFKCFKIKF
jgi:hypothetical protein